MKNIIIIGGDKRMLYLSAFLTDSGFHPLCVGLGDTPSEKALTQLLEHKPVTVILPLPVSRDAVHINTGAGFEPVALDLLYRTLRQGDRVFGGMIAPEIRERLDAVGAQVIEYYDEALIVQNAQLTAQSLPAVLREHTDAALHILRIAVTGYGRTAKAIADVLKQSGASVTVTARKDEALREAQGKGLQVCALHDFQNSAASFDFIVNTVPARIIEEALLKTLTKKTTIIEIASPPFGLDFDCAARYGVKAVKAISLPGRYAAQDAGRIIGEKLKRLL